MSPEGVVAKEVIKVCLNIDSTTFFLLQTKYCVNEI
jgi:hypothetical protein